MIEYRLRDYLISKSAILMIVGTGIHPVRVPRMTDATNVSPKLTYRRKSSGRDHYLTGASGHPIPRFEIVAWARAYDDAKALASAVRTAMDGAGPAIWGTSPNTVEVKSVTLTDEHDQFFEPEDGDDDGWFAVVLEYAIRHSESIPTFT